MNDSLLQVCILCDVREIVSLSLVSVTHSSIISDLLKGDYLFYLKSQALLVENGATRWPLLSDLPQVKGQWNSVYHSLVQHLSYNTHLSHTSYGCSLFFNRGELVSSSCMRVILAAGWDPSVHNQTLMHTFSYYNEPETMQVLLEDGRCDPSIHMHWDNCPLIIASFRGHVETVKLLLSDPRVDPTRYSDELLERALAGMHPEVMKLLLADGRMSLEHFWSETFDKLFQHGPTWSFNPEVFRALLSDPRCNPREYVGDLIEDIIDLGCTREIVLCFLEAGVRPSHRTIDELSTYGDERRRSMAALLMQYI